MFTSDYADGKCVRSGYCCKTFPCPFGKWDAAKHQCAYLEGEKMGKYSCGIYDEIMAGMPDNRADISPAFGAGCCSPFNEERQIFISNFKA